MMEVNKVILAGRIGHIGKVVHFDDNNSVVTVSLATHKQWKPRDANDPGERPVWHRIELRNEAAITVAKYAFVGQELYVEGELSTRKYKPEGSEEKSVVYIDATHFRLGDMPKPRSVEDAPGNAAATASAANVAKLESQPARPVNPVDARPMVAPPATGQPQAGQRGETSRSNRLPSRLRKTAGPVTQR